MKSFEDAYAFYGIDSRPHPGHPPPGSLTKLLETDFTFDVGSPTSYHRKTLVWSASDMCSEEFWLMVSGRATCF